MKCDNFKELNFKYGIFDNSIDCSYIIHLENDKIRLKNIKVQLNKYKPTKKIIIYNNKGFKKCKKKLNKQESRIDIIHCYIKIFKHALMHNYQNILVLEDNFILDRIILQEDITKINNFCNQNKHTDFMLSLGLLPELFIPINKYFYKVFISIGTHNMIYSNTIMKKLVNNKQNIYKYSDWDTYLHFFTYKYFYYKPLIFQKFELTENQKNWFHFFGFKYLFLNYMKFLDFENQPKRAFQMHYKIFNYIHILIVLIILYFLITYLLNRR